MVFVTTKQSGYVLFSMTPSEKGAMGLTDSQQEVHLLERGSSSGEWVVFAKWPVSEFSHTAFMTAWHDRTEPEAARGLLQVVPEALRTSA